MKRLLLCAATFLLSIGCSKYDDTDLVNRVINLENRMQLLETTCTQMNSNISSLREMITALTTRNYVTSVVERTENGVQVYDLFFSSGDQVTLYNGSVAAPQIGVQLFSDGLYYWTLNGAWLTDGNGNMIPASPSSGSDGEDGKDGEDGEDGITPQLKIEDGFWYVSYDNGGSWQPLGEATGEDGDTFFQSVTEDDRFAYFTLADGTVITLPLYNALSITFSDEELMVMSCNTSGDLYYTVESRLSEVKVEVISSADIRAKVVADEESALTGYIHIEMGNTIDEYSKVVVLVSNGERVIMQTITFEEAGLQVSGDTTINVSDEGGEVALTFLANHACEAVVEESAASWIKPASRAMTEQQLFLTVSANTGDERQAQVVVRSTRSALSLTYTLVQRAGKASLLALEREALIALYNSANGAAWTNNGNWCTDAPVSEWYGVSTNEDGFVNHLYLDDNNVQGSMTLGAFTCLESLSVANNALSSLDASGCSALTTVRCNSNQLQTLNVAQCDALVLLDCYNNQLTAIDVSTCVNLQEFACPENQLTAVDVSQNTQLTYFDCARNQLTAVDVSQHTQLTFFDCRQNQLTAVDVSQNPQLKTFLCASNQLTALDVTKNTRLETIECGANSIDALDVSQCSDLTSLSCGLNNLNTLDVSKNTKLRDLDCSNNLNISTLDVSRCSDLISLSCYNNNLGTLDVSKNTQLRYLDCSSAVTTLDVSKNADLWNLWCSQCSLTTLDLTGCPNLRILCCDSNQLTTLDVSGNPLLNDLNCSSNQLTGINLNGCPDLQFLRCSSNQLTTLEVSNNTKIQTLQCADCKLTELDITNNRAIDFSEFWVANNPGNGSIFPVKVWSDYTPNEFFAQTWDYNGNTIILRFINATE